LYNREVEVAARTAIATAALILVVPDVFHPYAKDRSGRRVSYRVNGDCLLWPRRRSNDSLWISDARPSHARNLRWPALARTASSPHRTASIRRLIRASSISGTNAAGLEGLWTTDGTAAGTQEIAGIAHFENGRTRSTHRLQWHCLFTRERRRNQGLWQTDGTAWYS